MEENRDSWNLFYWVFFVVFFLMHFKVFVYFFY